MDAMSTDEFATDSCLQLRALERQIEALRRSISNLKSQSLDAGAELGRLGGLLEELDHLIGNTELSRAA
jgi:hypothetical protein